jgi:DNA-binding winged helix-turn-helix (wHTH) protein
MSQSIDPSIVRYRFGAHVLDPARRELLRDGVPQALPARTFECLHCLIEHRDRAVGRDELVRAVFGRRDASDAQLAQIVLRARRAIGDDGHGQRAIRTVPRFGFRWAAEVEVVEAPTAPTQIPAVPHPPRGSANAALVIAFGAALLMFAWLVVSTQAQNTCPAEPEVIDPKGEQKT